MAIFTGSIFSEALSMDTSLAAIIPQDSRFHRGLIDLPDGVAAGAHPKTLLLLHGLTDNWAAWPYRSRILSYAERYDVAVFMPEVQRSFYQDMVYGEAYFHYIADELPLLIKNMFRVSTAPQDLMVAGLSMGGYGALRLGLTYPQRYRAIGAFSSAIDMDRLVNDPVERRETRHYAPVLKGIFGERLTVPECAKLDALAQKSASEPNRPPIWMSCGLSDPLYQDNLDFSNALGALGYDVTFEQWPGAHEWGFWDASVLKFLTLNGV